MAKIKVNIKNLLAVMNEKFIDLVNYYDKLLIVMWGGAGSGKSVSSAQIIVLSLLNGRNQLVVRKVARTNRNSVFSEIKERIEQLQIGRFFNVRESDMMIKCMSGAEAQFVGCDDVEKLKSIKPTKGLFDDIHIEEATEISYTDFLQISTRQRGMSNRPRRMFLRFNPIYENHWIKKEIFDSGNYDFYNHHSTMFDNRFLSQQDKDKYENYKNIDLYMYKVYCLGEWGLLGHRIFDKFEVVKEAPSMKPNFPSYGLDFGYENPAACVRRYEDSEIIYLDDEIYERKLTNRQLADLLRDFLKGAIVKCDSAEPKSIQELREYGINALSAKKGAGSVLSGIKQLKSKRIIINERCVNLIAEFNIYRRKVDKNGNVLEEPVDANNHGIDATRYAGNKTAQVGVLKN